MQRFSEDEAREILSRAVRQPVDGEYTHEDLVRSAAELGISEEALVKAQAEVVEERLYAAFEAERKASFRSSVVVYALVMTMLVGINLATGPGHLWFIYPLLGWGLGVAIQGAQLRDRQSESYRQAFARFRENHALGKAA